MTPTFDFDSFFSWRRLLVASVVLLGAWGGATTKGTVISAQPPSGPPRDVRCDASGNLTLGAGTAALGSVTALGSAGSAIQQGAGAASAATLRTTQSSDDAVPAATALDGGAAPARFVATGGVDSSGSAQMFLVASDGAIVVSGSISVAEPVDVSGTAGTAVQQGAGAATAATLRVAVATDANVVNTELPAAVALAEGVANPTTPMVGAAIMGWTGAGWDRMVGNLPGDNNDDRGLHVNAKLQLFDGADWDRARGDITNGLDVDVTRLPALVAGTATVGSIGAITQALPAGTNNIGDVDIATFPDNEPFNLAQVGGVAVTAGAGAVGAGTQRTTLASDDPAVAALQIIDDWDEANRAAVNAIAGQVGVQGGAGAATALTLRVTQATDDAAAVALADDSIELEAGTATVGSVQIINAVGNPVNARLGDGTDQTLVTAAGELNVIATAQPGVDVGDVTVNNAAGAAAVNVQDGGNVLSVDWNGTAPPIGAGTEAAALRVAIASDSTIAVEAGTATIGSIGAIVNALPAGTNNIGDVDVLTVNGVAPAFGDGVTGATVQRVTLATDNVVTIDGSAGGAVTQGAGAADANTLRFTQATGDAGVTSLAALDDLVRGEDSAHASLDSGVMMLAVASDAAVTLAGADSRYAPPVITRLGDMRVAIAPEHYIDSLGAYYLIQTAFTTVTTAGAEEIQPVAAQGAGNSIVLVDWIVATDTNVNVQFESDDSDNGITARAYLGANGGWTSDHSAAWGETSDNQALKLQVSAAATVSVQVRYFVR